MKIAIYGPMCSGKSTVAKIIQDYDPRHDIYSFGQKIKGLAEELFEMGGKDRSLLINIADKMREIDEDVWAKYIVKQTEHKTFCIIDDLRFQNELKYLDDWKIICLTTPLNVRKERIKELYPDNYEDHYKNMRHLSETGVLNFPSGGRTIYLSTDIPFEVLENIVLRELF
jgi:cytidylate kinase|tara:strand:- start:136 stop:645 length:510 start_codon:yes stop_codon:yes gene_type:complete